jgi:UDP-glucose 4-epimerase
MARKRKSPTGVMVTGICGRLGLQLVRGLHRQERVIGIDRREGSMLPSDVIHHDIDIRRRKSRDIFRKARVRAVVHLGIMHDTRQPSTERHSWNVDGFNSILQFIRAYRIPKLVLLSTGAVYGPNPDNPQFISEDTTLMGGARDPELRDLIEVDMLAQSYFWRNPECETVILRPTQIVGTVRNGVMEYARLPRPPMALGFDPLIQLVHEKDVVSALMLALEPGTSGIFNIAGSGQMPLSLVLERLGKEPAHVPSRMLRTLLRVSHRLKAVGFHEAQVDYIMYPCMLDTSRSERKLGFTPRHDIRACIEEARHCIAEDP